MKLFSYLRNGDVPVELKRLELSTPSMPWRCATSCATAPGWFMLSTCFSCAGDPGFEPELAGPKPAVLPVTLIPMAEYLVSKLIRLTPQHSQAPGAWGVLLEDRQRLTWGVSHPEACRVHSVPTEGLEPSRPFGQRFLRPSRLPIPPGGQSKGNLSNVAFGSQTQSSCLNQGAPQVRQAR